MAGQKSIDAMIEDFALAIGLVMRRIRADSPAEFQDFSWTQKVVIWRLDKDGIATTAELARAEGIKPQSMAAAIASLEELGLIERRAHPTDGRQVNIKLTTKGTTMRKNLQEASHNWLAQGLAKLDKQEQATVFRAGELLKRMVEER